MNSNNSHSPAFLVVGPPETTREEPYRIMERVLSKEPRSSVSAHQFLRITPEKKYTLDLLDPISHKIQFALDEHDHFFFILEDAHLLTPACANSLLKMVEEPPQGYHFIFLTSQSDAVLPTIRSRCQLVRTSSTTTLHSSTFLRHFTNSTSSPVTFIKDLQTGCPEDYETPGLLDGILNHWLKKYIQACQSDSHAQADSLKLFITFLQEARERPPMPGSSKLFWRNLFLQKERYFR